MSLPTSEQLPDDPAELPPARRRRAQRLLAPLDFDERTRLMDDLRRMSTPNIDFFALSLLSGLLLSLGLLLDTPALVIFGAALAPLMAPAVGISFGAVAGSLRLFLYNTAGLLFGCLLVLAAGWVTGRYGGMWMSDTLYLAHFSAQISWPNFLVLAASMTLTTIILYKAARSHSTWLIAFPNAALAYQLFLPLTAAGFGLGSGIPHFWPDGLAVFILHLSWSAFLGAIVLGLVGLRPLTLFGYTLSGMVALLGIIILIGLSGAGAIMGTGMGLPTSTPSTTPTLTNTPTLSPTSPPPTSTLTPTLTSTLTPSPTPTYTLTPTPVLAEVRGDIAEGARIRKEPNGETIGFLANGALIILLPETSETDGVFWVRVQTMDGLQGWVVQSLLKRVTATPSP